MIPGAEPNDNRAAAGELQGGVLTLRLEAREARALAKDGAELPARVQTTRLASFLAGPGETMDFEYEPRAPGVMRLDVEQRTGEWKTHLPIRVEARRIH